MSGKLIFDAPNTSVHIDGDGINGHVVQLTNTYSLNFSNTSIILGALRKGYDKYQERASNNTANFSGNIVVDSGTLDVGTGTNTGSGVVTLVNGTLMGTGTIATLNVAADPAHTSDTRTIATGASPGQLTITAGYDASAAPSTLQMRLDGTTQGTQYDQLQVAGGDVVLGNGVQALALAPSFSAPYGSEFWIVDNTGTGTTTGFFSGLPEGSLIAGFGGTSFNIYYDANRSANTLTGGNDVLLVAVPEPATAGIAVVGLGIALCRRRRRRLKVASFND
jgi:hypothetical protein